MIQYGFVNALHALILDNFRYHQVFLALEKQLHCLRMNYASRSTVNIFNGPFILQNTFMHLLLLLLSYQDIIIKCNIQTLLEYC